MPHFEESELTALENCQLFLGVDLAYLLDLISSSMVVSFGAGEAVFHENDESDSMFVILSGEIRISSRSKDGEVVLAVLKPCDFFGEIAMFTGVHRTTDAIAQTDSRLITLNTGHFNLLKRMVPDTLCDIYRNMLVTFCQRLKDTDQRVIRSLQPGQ